MMWLELADQHMEVVDLALLRQMPLLVQACLVAMVLVASLLLRSMRNG